MGNRLFLFIFVNCLLLGVRFLNANAYKVVDYDLEVAASDKHEKKHEEGHEEDHYGEHEEKKGEKGEKGYESKHG